MSGLFSEACYNGHYINRYRIFSDGPNGQELKKGVKIAFSESSRNKYRNTPEPTIFTPELSAQSLIPLIRKHGKQSWKDRREIG